MATLLSPGQRRYVEMPFSEVCMHMRIAGRVMAAEIVGTAAIQLFDADTGDKFSAPITAGEAGFQVERWTDGSPRMVHTIS